MSSSSILDTLEKKILKVSKESYSWFFNHPEWWIWFLCIYVWSLLLITYSIASNTGGNSLVLKFCGLIDVDNINSSMTVLNTEFNGLKLFEEITKGARSWLIMIVAMMFPLINEPVRHVSFSVKRKDRDLGILTFLIGYTVIWTLFGLLFLTLPLLIDAFIGLRTPFHKGLITTSIFFVSAIIVWLPSRPGTMAKCGQTMPIRIQGWQLHYDCIVYGFKIGVACFRMCWAPMIALILTEHSLFLMLIATLILIYERYRLPHLSLIPAYGWISLGLVVFGMGAIA